MGNDEDKEIRECKSSAEAQKRADYLMAAAEASGEGDSDDIFPGICFHNAIFYKASAKWQRRADELRKEEIKVIALKPLLDCIKKK